MQQTQLSPNDYFIKGNGSKWQGSSEDPIEVLLSNLSVHTLNPRFASKGVKSTIEFATTELDAHDIEFSGEVQYQGNFLDVSAGFNIYVKRGSRTEEVLDELIKRNINSFEYQLALGELNKSLHPQNLALV